jgi:acyl-CoA dehydrogenase
MDVAPWLSLGWRSRSWGISLKRTVFTSEHEIFRENFRRFLAEHVVPYHGEWEKAGFVPRHVWQLAGSLGFLCPTMPEEYGGAAGDFGYSAVVLEEIARVNATGLGFTLQSDIAAPYILAYGSEALKHEWLPKMASGEVIAALALTEPGAGSDLKAIRTIARRDGDNYVIDGQKTFITNGFNCDLVIVAAKTDPARGRQGVSLILVPLGATGFNKGRKLDKIGLLAQDTAELFFDGVRVPIANRLGEENEGFSYLMHQLAQERLGIGLRAVASIEAMLELTLSYAKQRKAFGKLLFDFQNTKFKLADARAQAEMLRCFADDCLAEHLRGQLTPVRAAMVKLLGTEMQNRILDDLLQLYGGYGFMSEYTVSRAWRDARIMRIYGGSSEIMREIIARDM